MRWTKSVGTLCFVIVIGTAAPIAAGELTFPRRAADQSRPSRQVKAADCMEYGCVENPDLGDPSMSGGGGLGLCTDKSKGTKIANHVCRDTYDYSKNCFEVSDSRMCDKYTYTSGLTTCQTCIN